MPKFSTGKRERDLESAKWVDGDRGFKGHIVRPALGVADAAEYARTAADLLWGVLSDNGTQLNNVVVVTGGVVKCVNSLSGTVNLGDPVILDYSNSGGTTGYAKSAVVASEVVPASGGSGDASYLANKAVPGSLRVLNVGTGNLTIMLGATGTSIHGAGTLGFPADMEVSYTIDQPVIGFAREIASSPGDLFKVEMSKQRYYKNNTDN